jgi:Bacterial CdiA-CT RNAse A domain
MRMSSRQRWAVIVFVCLAVLLACNAPSSPSIQPSGSSHNLAIDEEHGGHTLERHVGRTDAELHQRLERERDISAASTYSDRATAERVVGAALAQNGERIQRWIERGPRRPNLVLDYTDPNNPIGRTMFPRAAGSVPCDHAIVVLRADGDGYYVLTSYPECKP